MFPLGDRHQLFAVVNFHLINTNFLYLLIALKCSQVKISIKMNHQKRPQNCPAALCTMARMTWKCGIRTKNVSSNLWPRYVPVKALWISPWPMMRVCARDGHNVHFIIICGYKFFGSRSCQNESILLWSAVHFLPRYRFALRSTSIQLDSCFIATLRHTYALKKCLGICILCSSSSIVLYDLLRHYYFLSLSVTMFVLY